MTSSAGSGDPETLQSKKHPKARPRRRSALFLRRSHALTRVAWRVVRRHQATRDSQGPKLQAFVEAFP